jgi:SAM-dependent methyltransferase
VVAEEGVAGLLRRTTQFLNGSRADAESGDSSAQQREVEEAKADYQRLVAEFRDGTRGRGVDDYYWYHTVDLGNGLVTPGDYDFRQQLSAFGFQASMAGMRVLDVGSATGFFAFEFERRGAQVVSVELPSFTDWDIIASERARLNTEMLAFFKTDSPSEAYRRHLDAPFLFCQSALGSKIERCYSSVYDLTLAKVGGRTFDLIYAGDMLLHLFSPFRALDVLATLSHDSIVLTVDVPFPGPAGLPLMLFEGGTSEETDRRTWWRLSVTCAQDMLRRLGFGNVRVVGSYRGIIRRSWTSFERQVIWASRK